MIKSIKELAWNVSEKEYRADPGISYSTLSRFEREGWRNIRHLYDKLDTPSLSFGSAVDTLLTEGQEAFNESFVCGAFPQVSPAIISVVADIYKDYGDKYHTLREVPEEVIIEAINRLQYSPHWKETTRVKKILEEGAEYYNVLDYAGDKKILSIKDKEAAYNCVRVLKTSPITADYFNGSDIEDVEREFQLKFFAYYKGIRVRCMFDEIIVRHDTKMIYPIDLKTTGHPEEEFNDSFSQWRYDIQAKLYTYILQENIAKDEYFKDFRIAPYYQFIVINRDTLSPLVWEFDNIFSEVDMKDTKERILRDWRSILMDLCYYKENYNGYSREANENKCRMKIKLEQCR